MGAQPDTDITAILEAAVAQLGTTDPATGAVRDIAEAAAEDFRVPGVISRRAIDAYVRGGPGKLSIELASGTKLPIA